MESKELPKAYEAKQYEDAIYAAWEASGYFNPDNLEGEPFALMMRPVSTHIKVSCFGLISALIIQPV